MSRTFRSFIDLDKDHKGLFDQAKYNEAQSWKKKIPFYEVLQPKLCQKMKHKHGSAVIYKNKRQIAIMKHIMHVQRRSHGKVKVESHQI